MDNYQKNYENKIGLLSFNLKRAIAGKKVNCLLTYTIGELGIDESGSIKILWKIISDFGDVQFKDKKKDNYVEITSNKKSVKFIPYSKTTGFLGKIHERPWSNGFILGISNDYLQEGDIIKIKFKNWRTQTFCEDNFRIRILVDPFATGKYIEVPHSISFRIIPDKPIKLKILTPTKVKKGKKFNFLVKLEDRWGNPCTNIKDTKVKIFSDKNINLTNDYLTLKKGRALGQAKINKTGVFFIKGKFNKIKSYSNPILSIEENENTLFYFWADLHGQSEETVGTKNAEDYLKFAKEYGFLDVTSHQGNDFEITNKFWNYLNNITRKLNKDGEFIVFPGYEWSGNTGNGGDRNVIYSSENYPIFRSSHALIKDFSDIKTDAPTVDDLFSKLNNYKKNAMIIAHVGGRYANLSKHRDCVESLIEIHSVWGSFEWFLFEALKKNYIVGFVANSDDHTGRLGASYPTLNHFNIYGGLTCIITKELTRKSVFEALKKRHCYATTGSRIFLDVKCEKDKQIRAIMGDIIKFENNLILLINCIGTYNIDRIEIYNLNKLVYSYYQPINDKKQAIKIIWCGSNSKGRSRSTIWKGSVKFYNNKILNIKKINFFNPRDLLLKNDGQINWQSLTSGFTQGLILQLKNNKGKLCLNLNDKNCDFEISQLSQIPFIIKINNLDARLEINKTNFVENRQLYFANIKVNIENLMINKGRNPIFIKVIQNDGYIAWSSPIYIDK